MSAEKPFCSLCCISALVLGILSAVLTNRAILVSRLSVIIPRLAEFPDNNRLSHSSSAKSLLVISLPPDFVQSNVAYLAAFHRNRYMTAQGWTSSLFGCSSTQAR